MDELVEEVCLMHADEENLYSEPIEFIWPKDIAILLAMSGNFTMCDMACFMEAFRSSIDLFCRAELMKYLVLMDFPTKVKVEPQQIRMLNRLKTVHTRKAYLSFVDECKYRYSAPFFIGRRVVQKSIRFQGILEKSFYLDKDLYVLDIYGVLYHIIENSLAKDELGHVDIVCRGVKSYLIHNDDVLGVCGMIDNDELKYMMLNVVSREVPKSMMSLVKELGTPKSRNFRALIIRNTQEIKACRYRYEFPYCNFNEFRNKQIKKIL